MMVGRGLANKCQNLRQHPEFTPAPRILSAIIAQNFVSALNFQCPYKNVFVSHTPQVNLVQSWSAVQILKKSPVIVVTTHRSRNHGGQGGPTPPIYKSGPPPPPNVGAIKGIFFHIPAIFATIVLAQAKFLLSFTHFKNRHVHTLCIHVYVTEKNSAPPISNIFLLHCYLSLDLILIWSEIYQCLVWANNQWDLTNMDK